MITIERPINGISINGTETLLTPDGEREMTFVTKEKAFSFLRENGFENFSDDDLEDSFIFAGGDEEKEQKNCCSTGCADLDTHNTIFGGGHSQLPSGFWD